MNILKSKVVIIGAGNVGVSTAFCLINQGLCDEIALIDLNQEKAFGEVLDLSQSMEYMNRNTAVKVGTYDDCCDASIVIITASVPVHNAGNDRLKMLEPTKKVMKTIVTEIMKSGFDGHLIVVSNPVDVMTYYAYKISGLPARQVIGSGTTLDTARLKYFIAQKIDVDPRSVHALVIGEHGDSEIAVWSSANVAGVPLDQFCEMRGHYNHETAMKEIAESVKNSAYEIIAKKHATYYGIAMSVKRICECIMRNEKSVMPVSSMMHGEYGIEGMCLSMPAVVGSEGVETHVPITMNEEETKKLQESAATLKEIIEDIKL